MDERRTEKRQPSAAGSAASDGPAWRALLAPGIFTLAGVIILVVLGVWQLQRLAWKEALIARIEARTHAAPVPAPAEAEWAAWQRDEAEYRPITATGGYLYDLQVYVHGNAQLDRRGGGSALMGYFVLTPLKQADGSIIIVNRGFIPVELKQDAAAFRQWSDGDRRDGAVTVTGLLRAPQERGWFVPADVPEAGEWFTRDPQAIARATGMTRVAPFLIDAVEATGEGTAAWPRGGLTVVSFPNNHLDYAFTWFGLAVTLAAVFTLYARRYLADKERRPPREG
ncbi:surfeit locus 1 family protein [Pseudochelatococcus lubricantis]|uniref:SURF1-like protein n=1 Tax=Pseudochelatococcus lubricantis TaxID=1538102 RepID=A0ABX0UU39_9HYPH|nr:SURF1 family protein [Pseudochelatococcus lubricantis]NIJ56478.1 surfeit locus 1 family protein [Pseudochelatococcus lubricantis]